MDRGIPTEAVLQEMRSSDPPVQYLVGTPKGRLNRLESALVTQPWRSAREGVKVKRLPEEGELYVYAESRDRIAKERSMRRRRLKWLWQRLRQLSTMGTSRDALLMKLGQAQAKAPAAWRLLDVKVHSSEATFTYTLNRAKLKQVRRREGRYLLRTNLTETDPVKLWEASGKGGLNLRRRIIPSAARRENVSSSMHSAGTPLSATRCASVLVLPVPAPAITSNGPACRPRPGGTASPNVAAARCAAFSRL